MNMFEIFMWRTSLSNFWGVITFTRQLDLEIVWKFKNGANISTFGEGLLRFWCGEHPCKVSMWCMQFQRTYCLDWNSFLGTRKWNRTHDSGSNCLAHKSRMLCHNTKLLPIIISDSFFTQGIHYFYKKCLKDWSKCGNDLFLILQIMP